MVLSAFTVTVVESTVSGLEAMRETFHQHHGGFAGGGIHMGRKGVGAFFKEKPAQIRLASAG